MSLVKDAKKEGALKYERHKPEQTLLYQIIEKYYPRFLTAHTWADIYLVAPCGSELLAQVFLNVRYREEIV